MKKAAELKTEKGCSMKKVLVVFLALMLLLSGCVAVEGVAQEKYDALQEEYSALQAEYETLAEEYAALLLLFGEDPTDTDTPDKRPTGSFDEEKVISQLEVTEYSYKSSGWYYAFLAIKNNSEFDISVSVDVKFYGKDGELIGAKHGEQEAFESGTEILMYFMPDEAYDKMEYELTVSEEDWYECVVSDLTYESVTAKNKEIVSVTNNGTEAAEFVEGSALFFKGDKVVGFSWTYFTDDDSELKPKKTITQELDCYDKYDSVKFFFTGRR